MIYHTYLLGDAITWKMYTYRLQATCLRKAGGMCVAQGILYRKNIEKNAKIKDFGLPNPSQNPSEILPKSRFQKTSIFSELFDNFFLILKTSKPWKYQFYLGKIIIFKVFAKIVFLQLSCIFGQKNLPKTLPKRGPNPLKIDAKNVFNCF